MLPTKEEMISALEKRHGVANQKKFLSATVAICGLGGLGSNIAIALTRAGIGKLILIDFDRVDIANLNRQQYKLSQVGMFKTDALYENLKEISPYIELEPHCIQITADNAKELLKEADIICEAFDNAESKAMLTNIVLKEMPDKYLIAGSGLAGLGSANSIKTREAMRHFYICGDEVSDVSKGIGPVASRVLVCAAHQAHMVLRILTNQFKA